MKPYYLQEQHTFWETFLVSQYRDAASAALAEVELVSLIQVQ